jgi:hypothetical protein
MIAAADPARFPLNLHLGRSRLLNLVRIPVVTDTTGREVFLSRKQFWGLAVAFTAPGVVAIATIVSYAWGQSDRVLKLETIGGYLVQTVEQQQQQISRMAANDSTLQRIDQRLIDIERRMGQIENRETQRDARRPATP